MLQVTVKNYAGTGLDRITNINKTAGEYQRDLVLAGYKGVGVEKAIESGFNVVIDQFQIEVKQL